MRNESIVFDNAQTINIVNNIQERSFLLVLNFWLTCLLFAWKIIPYFENFFRSEIYNLLYLGFIALWFFTSICIDSKWIIKIRASLLAGGVWMIYFYLMCIPYYKQVEIGFINLNTIFIFPLFVYEFYNSINDKTLQNRITMLCIICFVVATISGLIMLNENEMAARMAGSNGGDDFLNVGGYNFTHALIVLLPSLLFYWQSQINSKFKKVMIAFLSMTSMLYILNSGYMISIISGIIVTMLYVMLRGCKNFKQIMIRIAVPLVFSLLIVALIPVKEYMIDFLLMIREYTSNVVNEKIGEMVMSLMYGSSTGDLAYRNDLTLRSFHTFLENFISGIGPGSTAYYYQLGMLSGHAQIPDNLARYGIIGSLILTNVYVQYYRVIINGYRDTAYFSVILSSLGMFIFIGLFNPMLYSTIGIVLFFIVPSIPVLLENGEKLR